MNDTEQIRLIRSQTLAIIAEITASPKPTYYIDGQSVSWSPYLEQLEKTVRWCDEMLASSEPYEIRSTANG